MASLTSRILVALLVSGVLVAGSFVWQGGYGFNIGDEGFLWYGVQRVRTGEAPLLDFMSYDPGRYYWSAALTAVLQDDGIVALRESVAVFQLFGLFAGLLLLWQRKAMRDPTLYTLGAITLMAWMYPRHKLFDISLSIALVGVLTLLVQHPSRRRFFLAGIAVGLVAVFGRNHGVYGVAGIVGAVVYLACCQLKIADLTSGLAYCMGGVVIGFLPIFILAALVHGFAAAFLESIRTIFERGTTNLPLPVPWPWLVPITQMPPAAAAADVLTGVFFIAILPFGICGILWAIRQALRQRPVPPEFVACSVLTLPYAHYAFSRADAGHLAQGIFPFLIGFFVLLNNWPNKARRMAGLAMAGASLMVMLPLHPGWECRVSQNCVAADAAGDLLMVDLNTASILAKLKDTVDQYAPNGRSFVAAPLWPGAYALHRRKSPMWEIYALFPRENEFQRQEIERIKAAEPGFVLILDIPVDGRDDLRFSNTHALVEQFIRDRFDSMTSAIWSPQLFQFYKARQER